MIALEIKQLISSAAANLGLPVVDFTLEHPTELDHGDYATNVALMLAPRSPGEVGVKRNPKEIAEQIVGELEKNKSNLISKIEVAGPGFINFYLAPEFFANSVKEVIKAGDEFGKNKIINDQKVIVEYTDPNPFKEFHIAHLMTNVIGEAISRLVAWNGAEIKRVCYQGDVGLHIAKAVWGMKQSLVPVTSPFDLGQAYAAGAKSYEESEEVKKEIIEINKSIYTRGDEEINRLYDAGKKVSLDYFDTLYKKLGTKFDHFFFESESGTFGKQVVEENIDDIFEVSEGAVVFKAEKFDKKLHTRVFINSEGLPTYEAKELGLAKIKYDYYPYDRSIVVTGNEINDYFRVLLCAMQQVFPELAAKTEHHSHGMLRLPEGKMSSRTGKVISAESLIAQVSEQVKTIVKAKKDDDSSVEISADEKLIEQVAIGAIKFSILKQAIGKDIVFDFDKSISFEGDSGPYLQYTYVRTKSILEKAKEVGIVVGDNLGAVESNPNAEVSVVEKLVYRLPEVIEKAAREYAPQNIITYLLELAGAYNSYYSANKIVDKDDPASPYRVALTAAVNQLLKNGLTVLGIPVPERM